jgi:predicted metalloprotease
MKWRTGHQSPDVIDQRGAAGLGGGGGGLFGLLLSIGSKFGIVGILAAVGIFFVSQRFLAGGGGESPTTQRAVPGQQGAGDEAAEFVSFVLDDVQDTWTQQFQRANRNYPRAKLVLFTDQVRSACGFASAASGPFYCPSDQRAYIDLGFYRELAQKFGAAGDFAQAYVIAHEIGHHVQNVLGIEKRVGNDRAGENSASVRLELQADCFSGVWAHSTKQRALLDAGDIEEGLNAAAAIGDDRLQRSAGRSVNPESFTHGSSEQRVRWFRRGLESGNPDACDTFEARSL